MDAVAPTELNGGGDRDEAFCNAADGAAAVAAVDTKTLRDGFFANAAGAAAPFVSSHTLAPSRFALN